MTCRTSLSSGPLALAICLALPAAWIGTTQPAAAASSAPAAPIAVPAGLLDQDGQPYDGTSAGRVRIVSFGYTNCPDICPTTLSDLSLALASVEPALRDRLQPVFVTVDPGRDGPSVLKSYLQPFGPSFVGVSGSVAAIDAYAWASGVYVARNDGSDRTSYSVDHTTSLLVIDQDGTILERIPYAVSVPDLAARLAAAAKR